MLSILTGNPPAKYVLVVVNEDLNAFVLLRHFSMDCILLDSNLKTFV